MRFSSTEFVSKLAGWKVGNKRPVAVHNACHFIFRPVTVHLHCRSIDIERVWFTCTQALKASSLFDKIKALLPFGLLPVYDVSVAPDDKNLGPNEVGKSDLAKLPGADNKFDTATPGV